ncbi:MAG: rRNA pseudouridine synthase, partial [Betaproteobacteria bacterium]|nr:rRNA pseudouridine synthase [Betaproteobacteria bacterium]
MHEKTINAECAAGEKVQKILAARGAGSRRAVEQLIAQGRVTVNGETAATGARAGADDALAVDGQIFPRLDAAVRLLCYHKPPGEIVERGANNSVFANLPPAGGGRWINIGRLDVNSEGLLLFCTDGAAVERIAHPRHAAVREYLARVDGVLSDAQIAEIKNGIMLDGKLLRPQEFEPHRSGEGRCRWHRIVLREGRNRAVRKLF